MTEQDYPSEITKVSKLSSRLLKTWTPGDTSPKVGLGLAEYGRAYMQKQDVRQGNLTRLTRLIDTLYSIATDRDHKGCVLAGNILLTRFYGPPPDKTTKEEALLLALQDMPEDAKSFIAGLILPNNESLGITQDQLERELESDLDDVEYANFEDIPANG